MAKNGALIGLAIGVGALALLAGGGQAVAKPKARGPGPRPKTPPKTSPDAATRAPEPLGTNPDSHDDQTALARMLESETPRLRERVVVGWITMQRARRLGKSIFDLVTGKARKYGPQELDGEIRYASTREQPGAEARRVARDLLAGRLQPSRQIREKGVSPWVELIFPKNKDQRVLNDRAERIIALQRPLGKHGDFGGIWARVVDSEWFLYSRLAPIITEDGRPGSALVALYEVPTVPALDTEASEVA